MKLRFIYSYISKLNVSNKHRYLETMLQLNEIFLNNAIKKTVYADNSIAQ